VRGTPPRAPRRTRGAQASKSATVRAAAAAPSRRQLSRWEREQRQQHLLYAGAGVLVLLVALIFGGGLLYDNVLRANESVAQVGPANITAGQLLDEVRPSARAIDAQLRQAGSGASAANLSQYAEGQKRQLPDRAMNDLLDATFIQQEAARRGISVSQADVDARMQQVIATYQGSSNPTPEATAAESPTPASPTATAAASSGTPTPLPTLQPADYDAALKKFLDQTGLTEQEERKQVSRAILRERVQQAIGDEQVPATQDQVHARQIVVPSEDQARDALNQLQSGADFASLAQQVSTDTGSRDSGGDLGWFGRGAKSKDIEDAAFGLQPGQLSDVIASGGSFTVLQVLERDPNRPLPAEQLTAQRAQAFNSWLSQRRAAPDVKLTFSPSQRDWVLSKIGVRP
jgi:parvulin-like peptidyl-prolyl isomerase